MQGRLDELHRTQAWLAHRMLVREATISRWCRGTCWPTPGNAQRAKKLLRYQGAEDALARACRETGTDPAMLAQHILASVKARPAQAEG